MPDRADSGDMVRLLHYSDVENAYDDPERIGRLAGAIERRRDDDTLVLGTGDNTGPGALALATRGEQSLPFFEVIEPDCETFGNHDFDYGPERTRELIERSPQPWLTANVFDGEDRFGRDVGTAPSVVLEVAGTTVGLIGVIDPATPDMCPPADDLRFEDPIEHVERQCARIEAEHVVVLSHAGGLDEEIARETAVDAVLGGHIHEERVAWVDDTPCTRPGANGTVLLEVDLTERSVTRHAVTDEPIDDDVAGAMRDLFAEHDLNEVVTHAPQPIDRSRETKRAGECAIGNFVADAYRWAGDADVGLQNTPGLRSGPPISGEVTVGDIVSLVPFNAAVAVASVTGERLQRILEQGDGERMPNLGDYWHAQISGATVHRGESIDVTVDGAPIDPRETYTIATTDYLFVTTTEFPALREVDRIERLDVQYEVIAEYARRFGIEPTTNGRIQGP